MEQHEVTIEELVNELMDHLKLIGYKESTRERYLAYYKVFIKYCRKKEIDYFSLDLGKQFLLEHHKHKWVDFENLTMAENYLQRHIWMLYEFQLYGEIRQKKRLSKDMRLEYFEGVLDGYIAHETERGLKDTTLKGKEFSARKVFKYFESIGIKNTSDIRSEHAYGFLASRSYYSITTKEAYQYLLRSLLAYMSQKELCSKDLAQMFPVISIHTKNSYPSYFTLECITKLLQSINTETLYGKRDYLILLLAATLGMRCIDICRLTLDDIDWKRKTIGFVQSKTGEYVSLPISDELLMALIDYIKNARPECDYREVLVSNRAPVKPFEHRNFHEMLQKYFKRAEITFKEDQKHGMHSMRSSLASNMLRSEVPIPVISNVLGHKYTDTTGIYIKIDLEGLRKFALEVPRYE